MGAIRGLLDGLLGATGVHLPIWAGPALVAVLVVVAWPWLRANARTEEARKLLRASGRARGEERARLEERALALVEGNADGLIALGQGAVEQGRRALVEACIARLQALRRPPRDAVARLKHALDPDFPVTPLQAALRIERLREIGATEAADGLLVRARLRWPGDDDLERLHQGPSADEPAP